MDGDQLDIGAHSFERVANAVMPFLAPEYDLHTQHREVARELFLNHRFVFGRDGENDLGDSRMVGSELGCVLPDRLSVDCDKDLFEMRVLEPGALSRRSEDYSDISHVFAAVVFADLRGRKPYANDANIINQKPAHSGLRRSWKSSK